MNAEMKMDGAEAPLGDRIAQLESGLRYQIRRLGEDLAVRGEGSERDRMRILEAHLMDAEDALEQVLYGYPYLGVEMTQSCLAALTHVRRATDLATASRRAQVYGPATEGDATTT